MRDQHRNPSTYLAKPWEFVVPTTLVYLYESGDRKVTLGGRAPVWSARWSPAYEGAPPWPASGPRSRHVCSAKAAECIERNRAWLPLLHTETWDRMLGEPRPVLHPVR